LGHRWVAVTWASIMCRLGGLSAVRCTGVTALTRANQTHDITDATRPLEPID
jgi:hypothetical protein